MNNLKQLARTVSRFRQSLPSGRVAEFCSWRVTFPPAVPDRLPNGVLAKTYTSKPLVQIGDEALFGELAIVRLLQRDSWEAAWVDTFHRRFWNNMPSCSDPVELSGAAKRVFEKIAELKGGSSGCLDVVAWKGDRVVFIEYKGPGDSPNRNEPHWIDAALQAGVSEDDLLFVGEATRSDKAFDSNVKPVVDSAPGQAGAARVIEQVAVAGTLDELPNDVTKFTDDKAYRRWQMFTSSGFVLATGSDPTRGKAVLHRAGCSHIDRNNRSLAGTPNPKFVAATKQDLIHMLRSAGRPASLTVKKCHCLP